MENIISFLNELVARLFSKTPKFQKTIRNFFLTLVSLSTLIITLQTQGTVLPDWLNWITKLFNWYSVFGGAVGAFVAQLSVIWFDENGEEINNRTAGLGGGGLKNPKP